MTELQNSFLYVLIHVLKRVSGRQGKRDSNFIIFLQLTQTRKQQDFGRWSLETIYLYLRLKATIFSPIFSTLIADSHTLAKIYLFKVNNRNGRKRFEKCTKLTMSLTSFWCFHCFHCFELWTYFPYFSTVSIVDFEQLNINWDL